MSKLLNSEKNVLQISSHIFTYQGMHSIII